VVSAKLEYPSPSAANGSRHRTIASDRRARTGPCYPLPQGTCCANAREVWD